MTTMSKSFAAGCRPAFDTPAAVSTMAQRGEQSETCPMTFRLDPASPATWPDEAIMSGYCWSR